MSGEENKGRSLSIEEAAKPLIRRKYTRNIESEVMSRRAELKLRQDHTATSPSSATIVNLQFGQDNQALCRRISRRTNKREEQPKLKLGREVRNRYHQLFRESVDNFFKSTVQIGPCAKSVLKEHQFSDHTKKLINIERLAFPLRQKPQQQLTARQKYKTLASRTSRPELPKKIITLRNHSLAEQEQDTEGDKQKEKQKEELEVLGTKEEQEARRELVAWLPVRRPCLRKDYFVFGLSERSTSCESRIELYRDFLWKINFSNGLSVGTPEVLTAPYRFYVGQGNNSNLIKGLLRRRHWWAPATSDEPINFQWTQLKVNALFSAQTSAIMPAYFVTQKNTSATGEKQKQSSEKPISDDSDSHFKIFGRIDLKLWKSHYQRNEKCQKRIGELTYVRRTRLLEKKEMRKVEDSRSLKIHNHLEGNYFIGNKKALLYNMRRYLQLKGEDPFLKLPLTFHVNKGTEDPQYLRFLQYYDYHEQKKSVKGQRNIWIVKPGQNTNRGNGITVCHSLDDVRCRLRGRERNGDGKLRTFILQKYIENPLLYNRRKIDLRHYLLVSCVNGCFKGYWYEQGYVRTASAEFSLRPARDPLVHLTNDAVQKYAPDYGKFEKANKLSYGQLQKYIDLQFPYRKGAFQDSIMPRMKQLAIDALKATYSVLDEGRRTHNFQLLGLDFMIDEDLQPWLIQVNTNPCLQLCCPLLARLIPAMVDNAFRICLDPIFPPPENWPPNRRPFFDQPLSQNRFQLVFDEASDGKEVEELYKGQEKLDPKMGKIEQDDQTFADDGDADWDKDKE